MRAAAYPLFRGRSSWRGRPRRSALAVRGPRAPFGALAVDRFGPGVLGLLDLDEYGRDVVFAATLVRALDQLSTGLADVGRDRDDLLDVIVGHHSAQAVRAENVHVSRARVVMLEVDHDMVLHAERPGDDVLGQLALLLVRQVRHGEQVVVDERMVAR